MRVISSIEKRRGGKQNCIASFKATKAAEGSSVCEAIASKGLFLDVFITTIAVNESISQSDELERGGVKVSK